MNKLKSDGFTLIELLAVIVILAIIIVIAVPSVLRIQENIKKDATISSALLFYKAVDLCISSESDYMKCSTKAGTVLPKYYEGNIGNNNVTINENGKITDFRYIDSSTGYAVALANPAGITIDDISNSNADIQENVFTYKLVDNNKIAINSKYNTTFDNFRIYGNSTGLGDSLEDGGYRINITSYGKNLISDKKLINTSDTTKLSDSWQEVGTGYGFNFDNLPSGTYTISMNINSATNYNYLYLRTCNENWVQKSVVYITQARLILNNPLTFRVAQDEKIRFWWYGDANFFNTLYSNFQLEVGDTATTFEAYKEPQTVEIKLNAPLDEDDYIDFKTGKINIDGTESNLSLSNDITVFEGTTNIIINTSTEPSKIELK